MRFKTESGTVYLLDKGTMSWCREYKTLCSGEIRQDFGRLIKWPKIVVGERAYLEDSKVLPGYHAHSVMTSVVAEILEASPQERE